MHVNLWLEAEIAPDEDQGEDFQHTPVEGVAYTKLKRISLPAGTEWVSLLLRSYLPKEAADEFAAEIVAEAERIQKELGIA